MSNTNVVPFDPKAQEQDASLALMLKRPAYAQRFNDVLGDRAPQFVSSLISIGNTMRDVEPKSIIGAAMQAAALDLPIEKSLGFAWIVAYKKWDPKTRTETKLAQFQMGYKGYIQLGQRSGQYAGMNAIAINVEAYKGRNEIGEPVIDWEAVDPEKEVYAYVFGFKLVTGFVKVCMWTKAKVQQHAKRYSQSFKSDKETPWKTNFDEMALKTVISNELRKWGILSVQIQNALKADQAILTDIDAAPSYPDNEEEEPKKPNFEPRGPQKQVEQPKAEEGDLGPQQAPATKPEPPPTEHAPTTESANQTAATTPEPSQPENAVRTQAPTTTTQPGPNKPMELHLGYSQVPVHPSETQQPVAPSQTASQSPPTKPTSADHLAKLRGHLEVEQLSDQDLLAWANGCGLLKPPQTSLDAVPSGKLEVMLRVPANTLKSVKKWKVDHQSA